MTRLVTRGCMLPALAALLAVLGVSGCAVGSSARVVASGPASGATSSPAPAVTRTLPAPNTVPVGHRVTIVDASSGTRLVLLASRPQVSATSLSSTYGYPPANGHYLTFQVTVVNQGQSTIDINPLDFRLNVAGERNVNTHMGNAPYSGAPRQLDATEAGPGETVTGPITFDVKPVHGSLSWINGGSVVCTWTF